ncbi:MAG: AraC family transcriptional regulator [Eubacteriales bacterium]|nr:AraC family transcriptional regulator [Eubacteriales bacterium]
MEGEKWCVNNYIKEELLKAIDTQNISVSYSGDFQKSELCQVHNSCEILFVEEGQAEYHINSEIYPVQKNTVLIIGATDRHRFKFNSLPYVRYGLTVMPAFMQSLPIINSYMNIYQTRILPDIEEELFQRMIRILWELREEVEGEAEIRTDMIYALLLEMTILLKRLLHVERQDMGSTYTTMNEVRNYIDYHYWENLSLTNLSKKFYLQPNTISKNFSRVFGKNINHYINSVRITNAVRILDTSEGNVNITELSEMVGYGNINTFHRQFKEKMEISPLQYMKRNELAKKHADTRSMFEVKK